jgi:copper chaperone CopZ
MKKSILFIAMMMVAAMSFAKDIKNVIVTTTPQMHCENCENKIKKNIRFEKGVKEIVTSVENQTVTITYDADKTSVGKLLKGFEKFGYTARELKKGEKVKKNDDEICPNM